MTDILEQIKAAGRDYDQRLWDAHLLHWWSAYGSGGIRKCVASFMAEYDVSIERFNSLKRIPRQQRHWRCCVTRFVAAYLPKISNVLFNGSLTPEQIIAAANKLKIDTADSPADQKKAARERSEIDKSERAAEAFLGLKKIRADARLATSKSRWDVCK